MEKDATDNVRHELDDQFAALRELIYAPNPSASIDNAKSPPAETDGNDPPEKSSAIAEATTAHLLPPSNYDQHVRELAFDKRAKPKDRTKTDEELALEAKEALEEAERKRRRRMLGLPESDREDETRKRRRRNREADDLDDDFDQELGEYEGLGDGLEHGKLSEDEDEGGIDGQESSEGKSTGDSQADISESEDEDGEGEEGDLEELVTSLKSVGKRSKVKVREELPFTFPFPERHEDFLEIVEGLADVDVCTVVQRMRTLYHASLAPDNKFKLQVCKYFFSFPCITISLKRDWQTF
jgi:nucleolar protein 14